MQEWFKHVRKSVKVIHYMYRLKEKIHMIDQSISLLLSLRRNTMSDVFFAKLSILTRYISGVPPKGTKSLS